MFQKPQRMEEAMEETEKETKTKDHERKKNEIVKLNFQITTQEETISENLFSQGLQSFVILKADRNTSFLETQI